MDKEMGAPTHEGCCYFIINFLARPVYFFAYFALT